MKIEMITLISNALVIIILTISELLKRKKNNNHDISKKIENNTEVELAIISKMELLKEYTNADRILMFEFHNGEYYSGGRSAIKTSCSFEVVRAGTRRVIHELKRLELNQYPSSINKILKNGYMECEDVKLIEEECPCLYQKMVSTEVKSFYAKLVKSVEGYPIGFLIIEFCENHYRKPHHERLDEIIGIIKDKLESLKHK